MIRRREFIAGLGAAAWPVAARAQQKALPVVGFLSNGSLETTLVTAFRRGLGETGYVEGQNANQLPALAVDLVRRRISVIATMSNSATEAAKAATAAPIVFSIGGDPIKLGFVGSLNRPGGNITGVSFLSSALMAKMVQILREVAPNTAVIAALVNPANPQTETDIKETQEAARVLGLQLHVLKASTAGDIDTAVAILVQQHVGALLIEGDGLFTVRMKQLVVLTARHAIPAIYQGRDFPDAGGLMSYGANRPDATRLAGVYSARILNGEKPADLPVQQSTKVELIINLATAKALGLTIPETLLATADEVIQ